MSLAQTRLADPVLTRVAQGYTNPDFVGGALFPSVPVAVSGGQIIEFDRAAFVRYQARRAPGSDTKRIPMGYFGRPYRLVNEGLDAQVPRELARDAQKVPGVDLGSRAINVTMRALRLGLEIDQAALARDTNSYPASNRIALAPGARWSDAAVNPSTSIEAGREAIRNAVGMYPNVAVLSARAYAAARQNPQVLDRVKYSTTDSVTTEVLGRLWDIPRVLVGKAVQAANNDPLPGPAPAGTFTDVWGTDVVLAYAPERPSGAEEPSFAYTYEMEGHPVVEEVRWDGDSRSWIYGVSYERAPVLSGISAGYLIQTAAA